MSSESKREHWDKVVREAYQSGEPIKQWCKDHSISCGNFHYWSKKLGYTLNGKRTEKCYGQEEMNGQRMPAPLTAVSPVFVEVPKEVLADSMTDTGVRQSDRPLITIQSGDYEIGVRDGFNGQTLARVLEVMRYA